jgi:hypothetical protein
MEIDIDKYKFELMAIDVIDGIDDNFYVIDVNGVIGVQPSVIKHQDIFHAELRKLFGNNYSLNGFVTDFELLNEGLDKNSLVSINNHGIGHEDKLDWRAKYDFPAPPINSNVEIHGHPDYPKFLTKPSNAFEGRGIELYNLSDPVIPKKDHFVEQYIPGKLINGHCYHSRLIVIFNTYDTIPLLRLNKLCTNPIIRDLKEGVLSKEQSLSYISNRSDEKNPNHLIDKREKWILNSDERFENFSIDLVKKIKATNGSDTPISEEIKQKILLEQAMFDFLSNIERPK